MKKQLIMVLLTLMVTHLLYAQQDKKDKKSAKEVLQELPETLIAQPDAGPDTNANKLISDNMWMEVNPLWKTKGLLTFTDFKLQKTDEEPLAETMPIPEKKVVQSVLINLSTVKKSPADKKQAVLNNVKSHLTAYYKEAGIAISAQELTDKLNAAIVSTEDFTTNDGRQGQLYLINDIQSQQSNFIALLILPEEGTPGVCHVAMVQYVRYTYETTMPEDPNELRTFVYSDEQETYVNFTKKMLKTVHIQ
ncbi:MAG: hypothetical protein U0V74_10460 [Chitinophagales bacterium]